MNGTSIGSNLTHCPICHVDYFDWHQCVDTYTGFCWKYTPPHPPTVIQPLYPLDLDKKLDRIIELLEQLNKPKPKGRGR